MFGKKKLPKENKTLQDLNEESSKSKFEGTKRTSVKEPSPKVVSMQKAARVIIWGFIAIAIVLGIYTMVTSKQPKIVKTVVEYNFAPSESETAKAYAVSFVKEFLTYNENKDDYLKRISLYLPNPLIGANSFTTADGQSEVLDAYVWKVDKLDNDHSNITVRAQLKISKKVSSPPPLSGLTNEVVTQEPIPIQEIKKTVFLSVPMVYINGQYVVDDYPVFYPDMEKPEVEIQLYAGNKQVSDQVRAEVKTVLENFFETYSKENKTKISYFMLDNKQVKGFEGSLNYEKLGNLTVYESKDGDANSVIAISEVYVREPDSNAVFLQRYNIELVKNEKDKRWLIKDFQIRGNIIHNDNQGGQ